RDLGKDEVFARQPLYGAAGKLVRLGLYRSMYGKEPSDDRDLQTVLDRVLFTNTVPYKPPGNKAYSEGVKKRFRPFLERLLVFHWQGNQIITLGNEAFKWFFPYAAKGVAAEFFEGSDRYTASLQVTLQAKDNQGNLHQRVVTLMPLPHPSPLNQQYYAQFPQMLQQRLAEIRD
ncbi:uracil-DNA glycosylase, partial [Planktothrix sp. FACHB-1355]